MENLMNYKKLRHNKNLTKKIKPTLQGGDSELLFEIEIDLEKRKMTIENELLQLVKIEEVTTAINIRFSKELEEFTDDVRTLSFEEDKIRTKYERYDINYLYVLLETLKNKKF